MGLEAPALGSGTGLGSVLRAHLKCLNSRQHTAEAGNPFRIRPGESSV